MKGWGCSTWCASGQLGDRPTRSRAERKLDMRKSLAAMVIGGLLTVGLGVAPAIAGTVTPLNTCVLVANTVTYANAYAYANGGRAGCTNQVEWVEVKLMHVQAGPLPDTTIKTVRRTYVTNATWSASNPYTSGAVYRTLTRSSTGASLQSGTSHAP